MTLDDLSDGIARGDTFRVALEVDLEDSGVIVALSIRGWTQELTSDFTFSLPPAQGGYELRTLESAAALWLLLISGNAADVQRALGDL